MSKSVILVEDGGRGGEELFQGVNKNMYII
jgi:hypothetical protein